MKIHLNLDNPEKYFRNTVVIEPHFIQGIIHTCQPTLSPELPLSLPLSHLFHDMEYKSETSFDVTVWTISVWGSVFIHAGLSAAADSNSSLSTLEITHTASCKVVSSSHKEPRRPILKHVNDLMWFLAYDSRGLTRPTATEFPSPHVWLNDHFPARLTSQQISFHDHFSLFLFLAWLGLFKLRGRRESPGENFFPSLRFCEMTAEWASIIEKAQTTTGWPC